MASELRLDPERLRELAAVAAAISDELALASVGPPGDTECSQVSAVAARVGRELAEVGAALFRASCSARSAEEAAMRVLGSL